jgi:hypothetical protein
LRDLTLNGTTYHDVAYVAQQQALCANAACTSYNYANGGYYLIPTSGGGGYGGFIRQEYYDSQWHLIDHHDVRKTCLTTDFNQLACP